MKDWTEERLLSTLVAEAEVAPIDKVAQVVSNYRDSIRVAKNTRRAFLGGSDEYEQAVFRRQDPYLNLILAGAVKATQTTIDLWRWAESPDRSADYTKAVRHEILSGPGALAVLKSKSFFTPKHEGVLDLADLLCTKPVPEEAELVLKNPFFKGWMSQIFKRDGSFSRIEKDDLLWIAGICSENPAFNTDDSDNEHPDLRHWDLNRHIFDLLQSTPASEENLWPIDTIVRNMQRAAFNPSEGFLLSDFCNRWLEFDHSEKNQDEDKYLKSGYYTSLSKTQEMLATFCAKFGGPLIKERKLSLDQAIKESDICIKAAYFGLTNFSRLDLEKIIELYEHDLTYLLLWNPSAFYSDHTRELLREAVEDSDISWLFKQQVAYLRRLKPHLFEGYIDAISSEKTDEKIADAGEQIQKISQQMSQLMQTFAGLKEQLRTVGYFAVVVLIVWLLKGIF